MIISKAVSHFETRWRCPQSLREPLECVYGYLFSASASGMASSASAKARKAYWSSEDSLSAPRATASEHDTSAAPPPYTTRASCHTHAHAHDHTQHSTFIYYTHCEFCSSTIKNPTRLKREYQRITKQYLTGFKLLYIYMWRS